ncbi:hypothetical protein [Actinomycetospora flava]|uniref:Uncharacterized protein n=1 Tax=Actinomycetospora flava TaxID=3129232 RepID=A0ABU8MC93_9PSEU
MSFLTSDYGAWWVVAGVVLALAATVLRECRTDGVPTGGRVTRWSVHAALAVVVVVLAASTAARFATVL